MPRVTIGLPVYNGEKFLPEVLQSLLAQTFEDFELIISDNASTDATSVICTEYSYKDSRIRYYRNEHNVGAAKNFNCLVERATGEYFKWTAHDDVCAPSFLKQCVDVLDRDPSVVVCFPMTTDIDEEGNNLGPKDLSWIRYSSHLPRAERGTSEKPYRRFRNLIKTDYYVEEIFGVIRTSVLRKTNLIQSFTDSDRVLVAQLGLYGKLYEVPEVLFYHRVHSDAATNVIANWNDWPEWYDTSLANQTVYCMSRQFATYVDIIKRTPLRIGERVNCFLSLGHWVLHKWPFLLMEGFRGIRNATQKMAGIVQLGKRRDSSTSQAGSLLPQEPTQR